MFQPAKRKAAGVSLSFYFTEYLVLPKCEFMIGEIFYITLWLIDALEKLNQCLNSSSEASDKAPDPPFPSCLP